MYYQFMVYRRYSWRFVPCFEIISYLKIKIRSSYVRPDFNSIKETLMSVSKRVEQELTINSVDHIRQGTLHSLPYQNGQATSMCLWR